MKVHKVVLVIVDHDGLGADEIKSEILNMNYPNDCISPDILDIQTVDIGEWTDGHPLNLSDPEMKEWKRLFPAVRPQGSATAGERSEASSTSGILKDSQTTEALAIIDVQMNDIYPYFTSREKWAWDRLRARLEGQG